MPYQATRLAKSLSDRGDGLVFDAGRLTVGDYLDRWLDASVEGTVRLTTYQGYEPIVRLHISPSLGRIRLKDLTPASVRGLLQAGLSSVWSSSSTSRSTRRSSRR